MLGETDARALLAHTFATYVHGMWLGRRSCYPQGAAGDCQKAVPAADCTMLAPGTLQLAVHLSHGSQSVHKLVLWLALGALLNGMLLCTEH